MAGRRRNVEKTGDGPDIGNQLLGTADIGGAKFKMFYSQIKTVQEAKKARAKDILDAYRHITGDERPDVSILAATEVVQGEVQLRWYGARGKVVPERVTQYQEDRVAKAKKSKMAEEPVKKKTRGKKKVEEQPVATVEVAEEPVKKARGKKKADTGTVAAENGKVSKKAFIRQHLSAGTPDDKILSLLQKQFPDGVHVQGNIVFQRNGMIKEGLLDAPKK